MRRSIGARPAAERINHVEGGDVLARYRLVGGVHEVGGDRRRHHADDALGRTGRRLGARAEAETACAEHVFVHSR